MGSSDHFVMIDILMRDRYELSDVSFWVEYTLGVLHRPQENQVKWIKGMRNRRDAVY